MKLTTKCRYGVRAILEISKNYGRCPTKRKDISRIQNIPDSFLENILIDLKHNGIISSIRGAKGGFVLKRAPKDISMYDILSSLEGKLILVDCVHAPDVCKKSGDCVVRGVWGKLQQAQEDILKETTIQSLLEEEGEKKKDRQDL